jgi:hypothetical protein
MRVVEQTRGLAAAALVLAITSVGERALRSGSTEKRETTQVVVFAVGLANTRVHTSVGSDAS